MIRRHIGKARPRRTPGEMNRTEQAYAGELEGQKLLGEILEYHFEAVKLKLAPATFYTPDFLVIRRTLEVECHEVKGHWEDDARVKIKCAAEKFPFRFVAMKPRAKRDGGGWEREEF